MQRTRCFNVESFRKHAFVSDFYFSIAEVDYKDSFPVNCEIDLIFGGHFPYWKVPGTEYPSLTERPCINALECYDIPVIGKDVANDFDKINFEIDDTFQYYCNMNGQRGKH